ncbi:UNVERIFIED_CONTAM: hypothetical protein FKN15_065472 [Acipenser sinensis]
MQQQQQQQRGAGRRSHCISTTLDVCLTCLKGEEWCFAIGEVGHIAPDQPPPWQEKEEPEHPARGPLLLPSHPEGLLLLPSPPEGPLLLPSPPEGPQLLLSPPEGPASPGVATSPAMQQEILWLEPHEGELPATRGGGQETRFPSSTFAAGEIVVGAPRRGAAGHEEGGMSGDQLPRSNFAAGERVAGAPPRGAAGYERRGSGPETTFPTTISLPEHL